MEGGIHHDPLCVVSIQDKSRLHSVRTQVSGDGAYDAEALWKLPGFSWNSRDSASPGGVWRGLDDVRSYPEQVSIGTGPVKPGPVVGGGGGGKWGLWREVGIQPGATPSKTAMVSDGAG